MEINSLSDAFKYVNERYIFNKENYPVIAKLTDDEKTFFALKHTLLHMQKSIPVLVEVDFCFALSTPILSITEDAREKAFLKILANMLVASKEVELSPQEIMNAHKINRAVTYSSISSHILALMQEIATWCEAFDHEKNPQNLTQGVLSTMRIKQSLKKTWSELLSISSLTEERKKEEGIPLLELDTLWNKIPTILKSA